QSIFTWWRSHARATPIRSVPTSASRWRFQSPSQSSRSTPCSHTIGQFLIPPSVSCDQSRPSAALNASIPTAQRGSYFRIHYSQKEGTSMDRKAFLKGCCGLVALSALPATAEVSMANPPDTPKCDDNELKFIQNWVTDLMDTIDTELDESTKIKLMTGCGKGCYRRFQFKQDIAAKGHGSVDKLVD